MLEKYGKNNTNKMDFLFCAIFKRKVALWCILLSYAEFIY